MHLIQILLPIYDNDGQPLPIETYHLIRNELVAKFGGLTAFTQSPAEGLWTSPQQASHRDDVILIEVMIPELDESWWTDYRKTLETRLRQESVVVRSLAIRLL
jgi:hypothetical protein